MIQQVQSLKQYDHDEDYLFNSPDDFYKFTFFMSMTLIIWCVRVKLKYS